MSENKTNQINAPWYVKAAVPVAGAGVGFAIGKDWLSALIGAIAAPLVGASALATYNKLQAGAEKLEELAPVVPQGEQVPAEHAIDGDPEIMEHLAVEAASVVLADPLLMHAIMEQGHLQPIPEPESSVPVERSKPMQACMRMYDIICTFPEYQDKLYDILDDLEEDVAFRTPEVTPVAGAGNSDPQMDDRK